jgi:hypothetical protein
MPQVNFDMAGGAFVDPPPAWGRSDLNNLRKEYREYSQRSLDKCFSYLNFYVGLLAALLAATLTGLLQIQPGDARALLLLTGPAAALALARLGYQTFVVFYRRYVESWVTEINLQAMLGTEHVEGPESIGRPTVRSQSGGWIARGERAEVKKAIRSAADAESLVDELTRLGDTRHYAKRTFLVFVVIAVLLAMVSVVIAGR